MGLLGGSLADSPVQPVYSEKSPSCQSQHNTSCHPNLVNENGILVVYVHWLGMYYDVPEKNRDQQIVPPLSFLLIWGFQNFQHNTGLNVYCVLVLLVRSNLTMHLSDTPFAIWQPIQRPHLLERVYKPIHTSHWCVQSLPLRALEIGCK